MINYYQPEYGVFCVSIIDLIYRSALVVFTLLRKSNYHYFKCTVCYVLPPYSQYCYVKLPMLFIFISLLHMYIFFYCPLIYDGFDIFIIIYFKLSRNFDFLTNIESIHLYYFWTQQFWSRQRNPLPLIFNHQQEVQISSYFSHTKTLLKDGELSWVGWFLWRRSWVKHKSPGFR